MFFYRVGYVSYEESPQTVLWHTDEFNEETFRSLCAVAAANVARRMEYGPCMSDISDDIPGELCALYGFRQVEYAAEFMPFGWSSLSNRSDWSGDTESDTDLHAVWGALDAADIQGPDNSHDH